MPAPVRAHPDVYHRAYARFRIVARRDPHRTNIPLGVEVNPHRRPNVRTEEGDEAREDGGLKTIAQSTFDKHQRFRPAGKGARRYNVIEIGAFGATASSSSSSSTLGGTTSAARQASGGLATTSLDEWMVLEDDLAFFMEKRPVVALVGAAPGGAAEPARPRSAAQSSAANATATSSAAAAAGSAVARPRRKDSHRGSGEVEAVASLKLVCIPRADPDDDDDDDDDDDAAAGRTPDAGSNNNTLAIARETFLRLYVDLMDADHCALYYLAREYDGYLEFSDPGPSGVATTFVATSDYALLWTFNRRTLETRGLFLDRCQRWPAAAAAAAAAAAPAPAMAQATHPSHDGGTTRGPAPPAPKKPAAGAWAGLRNTLATYRRLVFAPQALGFACCVQMLRAFDGQATARRILAAIARAHETLAVDAVAPALLDRRHRAMMQRMSAAVPALERHIAALEAYLRFLEGRAERLGGLVRRRQVD